MTTAPPSAEPYGPDNPRPWSTDHVTLAHTITPAPKGRLHVNLRSYMAPHEVSAVLRYVQAGITGQKLFKIFKRSYKGSQLSEAISRHLGEYNDAVAARRDIYGSPS